MGGDNTSMVNFRSDIMKLKPEFRMALPENFNEDRMARMCITVVQQNPALLNCTRVSLLGAMMTSAQLGLYPDTSLGHAYFLPFKVHGVPTCTFVAGYKGLIDLARRSGAVTSIMAYPVFEGDDFKFAYGTSPFINHVPSDEAKKGRELTHVYAMAKIRGEKERQFVVMSKEEVESIRQRSPGRHKGPWVDHYEQMALKTSIRRLCKYLPLSSELQRAVTLDEQADSGIQQNLGSEVDLDRLDAIDDEVLEGELVDAIDSVDSLDDLLADMVAGGGDEPSEYEKLCIQGMETLGDAKWKKLLAKTKKEISIMNLPSEDATAKLVADLRAAIKKGG